MNNLVMPQTAMDFGDYVDILRRRKLHFLIAFLLILSIGIVIAYSLPPVYRSQATIVIERQEIPQNLVATTVTGFVQERIQGIKQRLVTYDNIVAIEKKLNIFPEMRKSGNLSEMVALIRKGISVEMVDIKASDTKRPGQTTATIAFTVAYEANSAKVAQSVAEELSERYLLENKEARSNQAAEVAGFLDEEADKLRSEIVKLEASLAEFKQDKISELPELMQVNMRLYEKTEGQIESTKEKISSLEDNKIAIESELSLTDPRKAVTTDDGKVIQSPTDRLNTLIADFLQSSSRYTPSHPDVVRLRREIRVLGGQSSQASKVNQLVSKITQLRGQLLEARQNYGNEHPDVLRLEKAISSVETGLRNIELDSTADRRQTIVADNPRYVTLKSQLDATISNLREQKANLAKYHQKLAEYEKRLFQTPVVERDYKSLSRDYANAQTKYAELREKQLQARLAEQLEAGEKGERFVLAGKAYLPTSPDSPNRLGIVLLAGLLAISGGLGTVVTAEFKDDSVRGRRGVMELFGTMPIVVIPYIENSTDKANKLKRRILFLIIFLIVVAVALFGIHNYLFPLDSLWSQQSQVSE